MAVANLIRVFRWESFLLCTMLRHPQRDETLRLSQGRRSHMDMPRWRPGCQLIDDPRTTALSCCPSRCSITGRHGTPARRASGGHPPPRAREQRIFSIPRPWPGEGILRAYPGCVGQRHDSLDDEFLCAVPRPVIRFGDDRSVRGREQQCHRFEDRRLSHVTSTQDDVHSLRWQPSQGLDASETLNTKLADLRG